jgi:SAM-dependent methyltransferase
MSIGEFGRPTPGDSVYREAAVGGYSRVDSTVDFYSRVNALLEPGSVVADLGAGRGGFVEDPVRYRRELRRLHGKAARTIGLDVDPVVLRNPTLDEAHLIEPGRPFPLADASVDLVVSDYTFEHIDDPVHFAGETARILRPGGWLCARTPNKWGYIGVLARVVPNGMHDSVLRVAQPAKQERDTFRTRYRLNTRADLERHWPQPGFGHFTYSVNSEPAYFGNSPMIRRAARAALALAPPGCRAVLHVFIQKQ